ncbi:hypothetical protein [Arcobacter sp. YIC-310]|uniref:hypothetical protein n=1 Tax=Arcobacter sp. YIC-310 TaxID=3376632 RepID=UPI003C23FA1F
MEHDLYLDNEKFSCNIKNTNFHGSYGRVFVNENKTKAIKVFYKKQDDLTSKRDIHVKRTFESEIEAYQIAYKNDITKEYIPNFFGQVAISKIFNKNEEDVSNEYYTSYSYMMEYVNGRFRKLGTNDFSNKKELLDSFKSLGINNLRDISIIDENEMIIKIVDFSMKDIQYYV